LKETGPLPRDREVVGRRGRLSIGDRPIPATPRFFARFSRWLAAYEGYCSQILAAALPAGEEEVVDPRPGMIAEVVGLA